MFIEEREQIQSLLRKLVVFKEDVGDLQKQLRILREETTKAEDTLNERLNND